MPIFKYRGTAIKRSISIKRPVSKFRNFCQYNTANKTPNKQLIKTTDSVRFIDASIISAVRLGAYTKPVLLNGLVTQNLSSKNEYRPAEHVTARYIFLELPSARLCVFLLEFETAWYAGVINITSHDLVCIAQLTSKKRAGKMCMNI